MQDQHQRQTAVQASGEEEKAPLPYAGEKQQKVEVPSSSGSNDVRGGGEERSGWTSLIGKRASDTISHEDATIPLAWQALLTGLVDALIYSRSQIWTGFQTGEQGQCCTRSRSVY